MLLGLLLVGATLVAYLPALRAGYVWDDDLHLLNNPVLQPGGLARIWVPGTYINYWPLTFSMYWLENALWGVAHPMGFHLVNILLHAGSALVVWRVLSRIRVVGHDVEGTIAWGALLGAAIFALHPVNVESVAWVAQLKNVLSLFLALVAVWLYLQAESTGNRALVVLAVGVFALSTLAKGMAVTLPLVLLALAWWQRGRIVRRDVWDVLPFLIVGLMMACVEVAMQKEGQPWEIPRTDTPLARLAGAGWCVGFYFYKLIWPLNLCFVYPRWTIDGGRLLSFAPDVSLLAAMAGAWWQRQRWGRGLFMVIVCYVALLLPVLGLINIYFMRYSLVADHWQYAATIVPAAGAGALLAAQARRGIPRIAVTAAALALLGCLGALTYAQARVYKDVETLWHDVQSCNPDSWLAYHNLGNWFANNGRVQEAVVQYDATVRLKPDDFQAYNNLGLMLSRLGLEDEAIANFERALAIKPDYALARQNLLPHYKERGRLLLGTRDSEARTSFLRATQLAPDDAEAHYGLGVALTNLDNVPQAEGELQKAVTLRPDVFQSHDALARILATHPPAAGGDPDRAVREAQRACALTGNLDGPRLDTLGLAYAAAGRFAEAVATEEKALQLSRETASEDVVKMVQAHLDLFRAGKPYRAPVHPPR
jgi:tetratricopeptide (TPR) repeat protein